MIINSPSSTHLARRLSRLDAGRGRGVRVRLDLGLRARTLDGAPGSSAGAGICDVIGRQRLRHGLQRGSHRGRHGDGGAAAIAGRRTNCRCCYCCQLDVRQFDPSRALIPPPGQKKNSSGQVVCTQTHNSNSHQTAHTRGSPKLER